MRYVMAVALLVLCTSGEAWAACTDADNDGDNGSLVSVAGGTILYTGSCTQDDEVLIQTDSLAGYHACFLMSTDGAVDVFVTLDGTNYSTAALTLEDYGATDNADAALTTADRVYAFAGWFLGVRVLQNGATDASASLLCRLYGA